MTWSLAMGSGGVNLKMAIMFAKGEVLTIKRWKDCKVQQCLSTLYFSSILYNYNYNIYDILSYFCDSYDIMLHPIA